MMLVNAASGEEGWNNEDKEDGRGMMDSRGWWVFVTMLQSKSKKVGPKVQFHLSVLKIGRKKLMAASSSETSIKKDFSAAILWD